MKLIVELTAAADCEYDQVRAPYTVGARIRNAIREHSPATYDHDSHDQTPWTFALPEWQQDGYERGETAYLVVSSYDRGVLEAVSRSVQERPEIGMGRMIFDVERGFTETNAVRIGERGRIRTRTGVILTVEPRGEEFWTEENGTNIFRQRLEENVHSQACNLGVGEWDDGPVRMFDDHELVKTFSHPIQVSESQDILVIASKWVFDYEVRDRTHRDYLNVALDAGIGAKTAYGFGFCEVMDDHREFDHNHATAQV